MAKATEQDTAPKDWDLIEKDWRAGIKTKAQMAAQYGVSRAAMDKHFAKKGISRDLGDKIRAEADARVAVSVVEQPTGSTPQASEREIVEANAALQTSIILAHRTDIQRSRRLSMSLLEELEMHSDNADMLRELAEALLDPEDKGTVKRLELLERAISLGSRVSSMKTLTDALRTLVSMERQAFGLDDKSDDEGGGSGIEDVIRKVKAKNGSD